jgi:hypothetical protein
MASRTASSSPQRPNHRASLALFAALCGVLVVPAAVVLARQSPRVGLLDAGWAAPVALVFSIGALLFARGASSEIDRTLDRAAGRGRVRASRWLAVAGISIALAAAIAVGFYHLLLHLEG